MKTTLSTKERIFCEEMLLDMCQTKAAIRAGYSAKSAKQQASRMMARPEIQAHLKVLLDNRSRRTGINADDVLEEIRVMAYARMGDYVEFDKDGNFMGFSLDHCTPDQLAAITELKVETVREKVGEDEASGEPEYETVRKIQLKLASKPAALRDLGNHLGLFRAGQDDMARKMYDMLFNDRPLPKDAL